MRVFWLGVLLCGVIVVGSSAVVLSRNQNESRKLQIPIISAVAPRYPVLAVASNTSGEVAVRVKVAPDGHVRSASAIQGHRLLRSEAEKAARRWQFASLASRSERTTSLRFMFRILPEETPEEELTAVFTMPNRIEVRHRPFQEVVDSDPANYVHPSPTRKPPQ